MGKHNHIAIVVAVVAQQIIGALWYSVLFGTIWAAGIHMDMAMMQPQAYMFILDILGAFATCYGLSWLLGLTGGHSLQNGVKLGALVWFCFLGLNLAAHQAFFGHEVSAMLVDGSVIFVVSGAILGAWAPKKA